MDTVSTPDRDGISEDLITPLFCKKSFTDHSIANDNRWRLNAVVIIVRFMLEIVSMVPFLKILKKSMVPQLCFAITLFTSGIIVNLMQGLLYLCLRPTNKQLYRKINWYLCYTIYSQLVWLGEWWSGIKLIIYMDKNDFENYLGKRHAIYIMNHTYEIDWLITMIFAERVQLLGNTKSYVKKALQYIPVIGWSWKLSDYVMLERSFEKDKEAIMKQVENLPSYPDPMALLLFLEGTRFTPEKHKVSEEFARLNKMPALKYHLQPRTRGFVTSIPPMKGKVPDIYDMILAFKEEDPVKPTMKNLMLGKSLTAYIYMKRIPMEDLPNGVDELKKYCEKIYVRKDKLKESFVKNGDFFATSGVPRAEPIIPKRRYYSLINVVFWAVIVLCPLGYYIIGLLYSGNPFYCAFGIGIIGIFASIPYSIVRLTRDMRSSYGTTNS